ncbi:MAG: Gx transporter family protein [Lachnospiraceae bacterium]|nr:Gx transporter family protein [Lachnospiraceae bacterium]
MMRLPTKKLTALGLLLAVSVLLGFIEHLLPVFLPVPGAKLGLANLVVLLLLFTPEYKWQEIFCFQLARVVLTGLLFANLFSLLYSLAGMLLSLAAMLLVRKCFGFGVLAVSMVGGVFHNIGQILVAAGLISGYTVLYYLPSLLVFGLIAGFCMGVLSHILLERKIL